MATLALFDVDGTLISGAISHWLAFSEAFRKVYGVEADASVIKCHGMTDWQIIVEVLRKSGLDDNMINAKMTECMSVMEKCFAKAVATDDIRLLNGVMDTLKELESREVRMGIVTGNLRSIALGKMKKVGLERFLKLGGFGNDSADRARLVQLAIERAESEFGAKFGNVFLFGDTPRDIEAGKKAAVKTVGVATGIYSKQQLSEVGADFVLDDLSDTPKVLKIVLA